MEFIDLHTHILPGVDDGPRSLEETVETIREAHRHGTRRLVATPHMFLEGIGDQGVASVRLCFRETQQQLAAMAGERRYSFLSEVSLYLGAENYLCPGFLEAVERKRVQTINGSRYLLIEFPPMLQEPHYLVALRSVQRQGYVPVLAHVERYREFQRDSRKLERVIQMGGLTQVNASSVTGSLWSGGRRRVLNWLRDGLVSMIASDGHDRSRRPPVLSEAYQALEARFPRDLLQAWFLDNPSWILAAPPDFAHVD